MADTPNFRQFVDAAAVEDLPSLVGKLAEAQAVAMARLSSANTTHTPGAERWIKPQAAAEIAGIEVRTLYDWSLDQPWASRKTKRTLRIEEFAFRRWLAARKRP